MATPKKTMDLLQAYARAMLPEQSLPENSTVEAIATTSTADADGEGGSEAVPEAEPLTLEERIALALEVGEECIQEEELAALFAGKPTPVCYDGFEPSGRMHIAQGLMKAINVNKLTGAGCQFVFWVADWFALLNNKMGGDLEKIRTVGEYMIEVWKACGMDMEKVVFKWAADEINANANDYWLLVMDIARTFNITRVKRCGQIMGRSEGDGQPSAQILYPCMQCADIFFLRADICQLGMDQRKVNMLAREYVESGAMGGRYNKPVILSHHMLMGLKQGQEKMSKSDPDSAIFMEDSEKDVNRKIRSAFCPPGQVEENPILDYVQHIIFAVMDEIVVETRDNGTQTYTSYADLEAAYASEAIHPSELKPAVAAAINALIEPVRAHFTNNARAASLLEQVQSFRVTR